ncbi:MAG TPA: hypothetical protein DEB44_01525 [Acidimicrobiaceae bacterium]|nr:hypothetical protein [Acidimicrobiaceae bacterium]
MGGPAHNGSFFGSSQHSLKYTSYCQSKPKPSNQAQQSRKQDVSHQMSASAETDHGDGQGSSPIGDIDSFPSDAELSRTLLSSNDSGVLSTLTEDGYPYGSLVSYVPDLDGNLLLLISDLAEHTKNARSDSRSSFLVSNATSQDADPLTGPRLTLVGSIALAESPDKSAELYLAQHPYASAYAHFKDFNYWKLSVSDCRFVGGFGHMSWVEGENYSSSEADPFAQNAEHAIQHMNDDHADANLIFVQERGGLPNATEATMVGVDRYGMTFSAETSEGPRISRVAFPDTASEASQLEPFVINLLRSLRSDV